MTVADHGKLVWFKTRTGRLVIGIILATANRIRIWVGKRKLINPSQLRVCLHVVNVNLTA